MRQFALKRIAVIVACLMAVWGDAMFRHGLNPQARDQLFSLMTVSLLVPAAFSESRNSI
jgi:hypothetical protein